MPSIHLSYVNMAMDAFGLLVTLIIFSACLSEWLKGRTGTPYFLFMLAAVSVALIADAVSWSCEGKIELSLLTIIFNTVASCAGQLSILFFMQFVRQNLYANSRAAKLVLQIFTVLCALSLVYCIGNAFLGYSFAVGPGGHYKHSGNVIMVVLHLLFSLMSFFVLLLMLLFATRSAKYNTLAYLIYTVIPMVGIVIDYTYHGISLTYISFVISIFVLYTDIYLKRQRMIDAQANALMLSQINPHFMYNTLSTIAAMCDVNPKLAKNLTIDFSRYLRQNLESMSNDEMIPFEKELGHVECYLKIEKARFRERLNVIYSIQCTDFEIPPLTVQPIVENAVKHGITKKMEGGTLKIATFSTDTSNVIEIIDDGVGFDMSSAAGRKGNHVGIKNVQSRVQRVCKGTVSIKSTPGIGTRVTVEIPRKKGKKR